MCSRENPTKRQKVGQHATASATPTATEPGRVTCPECQRDLPASNLALHEIRCRGATRRAEEREGLRADQPARRREEDTPPHARPVAALRAGGHPTPDELVRGNSLCAPTEPAVAGSVPPRPDSSEAELSSQTSAPASRQDGNPNEHAVLERVEQEVHSPVRTLSTPGSAGAAARASATVPANNNRRRVPIEEGQWQCPRCTLVNERNASSCNACLLPRARDNASPQPQTVNEDGWVDVAQDQYFRQESSPIFHAQNPLARNAPVERVSTAARVFQGVMNGAIIGSMFGGGIGMVFGGALGGLVGAAERAQPDRTGTREEQAGAQDPGVTVRAYQDNAHAAVLVSDSMGRRRVIPLGSAGVNVRRGTNDAHRDLERSLLEALLRMSHGRDFGPGPERPVGSYEELLRRFGAGNENRGASRDVIDSYPTEVVGEATAASLGRDDDAPSELGTCGICLEDFKAGDVKKSLSCPSQPHSFHKDCIDKWLGIAASCPMCKHEVGRYQPPAGQSERLGVR